MEGALKYISILGAIVAFVFSVIRYIDVRRREEQTRRFEQFHKIFEWVAGRTATGHELVDTQQALAVYELSEFPEYRHIIIPILEYYLAQTKNDSDDSLFKRALLDTLSRVRK